MPEQYTLPPDVEATFVPFRYDVPEVIDLERHRDRLADRKPVGFTIPLYSWPGERFRFRFRFSNPTERWLWSVKRLTTTPDDDDELLVRSPAVVNRPYRFRDRLLFTFTAATGESPKKVDDSNLGRSVDLTCYPGPESDAFPFDLDDASDA